MTIPITPQTPIVAPNGPYQYLPFPNSTPWGKSQTTEILMWGADRAGSRLPLLWQTNCAGHGGTRVHRELAARFLQGLPKQCHAYGGSRLWYEEDIESCVPLFIFYNGLHHTCWLVSGEKPYPREQLFETIQRWMPDNAAVVRTLAGVFDKALAAQGTALREPLSVPLHVN